MCVVVCVSMRVLQMCVLRKSYIRSLDRDVFQIINFHDDEELQCHVNMTMIEMIIITNQMYCSVLAEYTRHRL